MKILYATSEAYPFAMSGGLADVAGALPKALRRRLVGCRVIMPLYEEIPEELKANMNFITSITVPVSWRRQYCELSIIFWIISIILKDKGFTDITTMPSALLSSLVQF